MSPAKLRLAKLRATTAEWETAYPWHYSSALPSTRGPVVGADVLAGGAPFGIDPHDWVLTGITQNPNIAVAGAPANGKSGFVKLLLWWLVGAFGHRMVVVDVKGEYTPLAAALGVPILDLYPTGPTKVNPLDVGEGRLEFVHALAALCLDRPLAAVERAALSAAVAHLPDGSLVTDLVALLRAFPTVLCDELAMNRERGLDATSDLRFGLGELLAGPHAGMFDGATNVDLSDSPRGFVVDVSRCGSDDRALRFAMLAGSRATDQMIGATRGQTVSVNDEAWRLAGTRETVLWLQHAFKLGRGRGLSNLVVVHQFAELGGQADGATAKIASRLVSDADTHVMFRQGDLTVARDTVIRLGLPNSVAGVIAQLPPYRALVHVRGRFALIDIKLPASFTQNADTNAAMRTSV